MRQRGTPGQTAPAAKMIRSIEGILRASRNAGRSRLRRRRLLIDLICPRADFPKTVSSTRRQYASMTFAFSADSPLVTCISGPNPESVAVRLTIM